MKKFSKIFAVFTSILLATIISCSSPSNPSSPSGDETGGKTEFIVHGTDGDVSFPSDKKDELLELLKTLDITPETNDDGSIKIDLNKEDIEEIKKSYDENSDDQDDDDSETNPGDDQGDKEPGTNPGDDQGDKEPGTNPGDDQGDKEPGTNPGEEIPVTGTILVKASDGEVQFPVQLMDQAIIYMSMKNIAYTMNDDGSVTVHASKNDVEMLIAQLSNGDDHGGNIPGGDIPGGDFPIDSDHVFIYTSDNQMMGFPVAEVESLKPIFESQGVTFTKNDDGSYKVNATYDELAKIMMTIIPGGDIPGGDIPGGDFPIDSDHVFIYTSDNQMMGFPVAEVESLKPIFESQGVTFTKNDDGSYKVNATYDGLAKIMMTIIPGGDIPGGDIPGGDFPVTGTILVKALDGEVQFPVQLMDQAIIYMNMNNIAYTMNDDGSVFVHATKSVVEMLIAELSNGDLLF